MKAKYLLPLFFISILFFSCNNGISSGTQGSISFDAGETAQYIARNATENIANLYANNNSFDESQFITYSIKIAISTEGDYEDSAEKEYTKKLSEIYSSSNQENAIATFIKDSLSRTISIKGIPVGSSIKVKLSISNKVSFDKVGFKASLSGSELPQSFIDSTINTLTQEANAQSKSWNGESETFAVKRGENKINITIKGLKLSNYEDGKKEGTNIILYNSDAFYIFPSNLLTTRKILSPDIYQLNNRWTDFVVDKNNKFYYAILFEHGSSENYLYVYENNSTDPLFIKDIGWDEFYGLYIEQDSGILFYITRNGGGTKDLHAYDTTSGKDLGSNIILNFPDDCEDFAVFFDSSEKTQQSLIYHGALYYSQQTSTGSPQTYGFRFVRIPLDLTIGENCVFAFGEYTDEQEADLSEYPNLIRSLTSDSTISDMMIQDNKLYALMREVKESPSLPEISDVTTELSSTFSSRGAIIIIDLSNFTAKPLVYGNPSIMTSQTLPVHFDMHYQTYGQPEKTHNATININLFQASTSLFGPEKFIAIKPKKLIISDNGYFFYIDDDGNFCFKNINKVVEFETDTELQTSYNIKTSIPIYFNEEENDDMNFSCSGTGFESFDATITCKRTN